MKFSYVRVFLALCWLSICTLLLMMPGEKFPKENWLDKIWADKWVHVGLFAVMVCLWSFAAAGFLKTKKVLKPAILIIALVAVFYGVGMEFVQRYLVVNRSFDVGDIVADATGSAIGWIYSYRTYIKK